MENSENKEIIPFDPTQAMQSIKDKIKSAFVELIPDEQWHAMVKAEVDSFFNDTEEKSRSSYGGNSKIIPSVFKQVVREELKKMAREKLEEYLRENTSFVWQNMNGNITIENAITNAVKNNASHIFMELITREVGMRLSRRP